MKANPIAGGCLFAFVGIILVAIGLSMMMDNARFLPGTVSAQGIILMRCHMGQHSKAGTNCQPIVRFTTQTGQQVTFQSSVSASAFHPDNAVTVKYHPNNPQDGRIDGWETLLFPLLSAGVGSWFVLMGLFVLLRGIMRKRVTSLPLGNTLQE